MFHTYKSKEFAVLICMTAKEEKLNLTLILNQKDVFECLVMLLSGGRYPKTVVNGFPKNVENTLDSLSRSFPHVILISEFVGKSSGSGKGYAHFSTLS